MATECLVSVPETEENDSKKIVNEYVNYVVAQYIIAGGNINDVDWNRTYRTLKGVYDREGKEALHKFVKHWTPLTRENPQ